MLEMMLSAGGSSRYYPDSGPGSKKLVAGNEDLGFFGALTYAEFGAAALNAIKKYTSTQDYVFSYYAADTTNVWYKFFLRKKVIYIPQKPIGTAAYYRLLASGMVAGEDALGGVSGYTAVEQSARGFIFEDKNWPLRIRLLRKTVLDKIISNSVIYSSSTQDSATSEAAIWGKLMSGGFGAGAWPAKPTPASVYSIDPFNAVAEGWSATAGTIMRSIDPSSTNTYSGVFTKDYEWRPVLELLPNEVNAPKLFPITPTISGDALIANSAYVETSETLNRLNVEFAGANMSTSTPYQKRADDAQVLPAIFVDAVLSTQTTTSVSTFVDMGSEFSTNNGVAPNLVTTLVEMGSEISTAPGGVLPNRAYRSGS